MNIRDLRKSVPDWTWSAERYGTGWRYVGTKGGRKVTMQAFSVLCGPGDDDSETQWRAEYNGKSITAVGWLLSVAGGDL